MKEMQMMKIDNSMLAQQGQRNTYTLFHLKTVIKDTKYE